MPGFNPVNEKLKKQYEDALLHGRHRERRTVDAAWKAINLFETFTGRQPFTAFSTDQAKGFKTWLAKQENEKGEPLSLSTVRAVLSNVRDFFLWLVIHPQVGRKMDGRATEFLRLSTNDERAGRASKPRIAPTIEQVRQVLLAMPNVTALDKRNRALIAFTALTVVRDAALISLKLGDVDVAKRTVWQDPKHVKTKFRKGILTAFIPADKLWEEVVLDWIAYARQEGLEDSDPLFPSTAVANNAETLCLEVMGLSRQHWSNANPVRVIFREAFKAAGLPYFHPHTFRSMLAIWGMEHCTQLEYKALSQNMGHEHAMTTYNAYGYLQTEKQVQLVHGMGRATTGLGQVNTTELLAEVARRAQN